MTMTKTAARLGAGTIALATVAAGLSCSPAAAEAATPPPYAPMTPTKIVAEQQGQWFALDTATRGPSATRELAKDASEDFYLEWLADSSFYIHRLTPDGKCMGIQENGNLKILGLASSCVPWRWDSSTGALVASKDGASHTATAIQRDPEWGGFYTPLTTGVVESPLQVSIETFSARVSFRNVDARTAVVKGHAVPDSTVMVNRSTPVAVDATGTWEHTVSGLQLGENTITLEQYEGPDNKTAETSVVADLKVTPMTVETRFTAGDVAKPLTIFGSAHPGASVEVSAGGTTVVTIPATDSSGTFSADIPAPNAGGIQRYSVQQFLQGEAAPDVETVTADFGSQIEITAPVDGQIHGGGALRFHGVGVPGGKVELRERGAAGAIGATEVSDDGVWSLDTTIAGSATTYVATQTGRGNNVTTASVSLNRGADLAAPVVNPVAPGSNRITGTGGTPGSTIILRDAEGDRIDHDRVDQSGDWDVTVPVDLGPGTHDLTVVAKTDDGEESEATKVVVDFGRAVDGVTPSSDVPVTETKPTFTGTGQPGASVVIAGTKTELARTTVKPNGNWTATSSIDLAVGSYRITATQITGIGVRSVDVIEFQRKNESLVAAPVKFETPATGSTVHAKRPMFAGTGDRGATIEIRGTNTVVASTRVGTDGTWSVASSIDLQNGHYRLFAAQTPSNGAKPTIDETTFKLDHRPSADVVVTGPTSSESVAAGHVVFTGTGEPNASITISGTTTVIAEGTVDPRGNFVTTSKVALSAGDYRLIAKQIATNGEPKRSDPFLIKVRG